MKALSAAFLCCLCLGLAADASAVLGGGQASDGSVTYADGLRFTKKAPETYLLTWDAYKIDPCEERATYSVYRGDTEDFQPSTETLLARGLSGTSFLAHEQKGRDYYYLVIVNLVPVQCTVRSGLIEVFPLDLGDKYSMSAGAFVDTCTAQSTTEIWCPSIKEIFHAVVAEQAGHQFLIGCEDVDFNGGAWNCVDLRTGEYEVVAHSSSLTILNGGWVEANARTGKPVAPIVPVFSVLDRIR